MDGEDSSQVKYHYYAIAGESDYLPELDINNDGIINIIDMSRVGFEYETR